MSQSGSLAAANSVPSNVAQAYVTDNGTAIPALNILNVLGGGSITTSGLGDTLTITDNQSLQVIRGPIVDFTTVGDTTIYTFTDDFIVTSVVLSCVSLTGVALGDGTYNVGWTGPNYNDITGGIFYPQFLGEQTAYSSFFVNSSYPFIPAGTTLVCRVPTPESGASVLNQRVDIIGYYFTNTGSGGGGSSTLTLTGDTGGPIQPVTGNWDIVGGTGISVDGTAGTLTINGNMQFSPKITISNAQLKSMFTTPIEIVAAPGAGFVIAPVFVYAQYNYGGNNALTGGGEVRLYYGNARDVSGQQLVSSSRMTGTASVYVATPGALIGSSLTAFEGLNLTISNAISDFAGNAANDNTMTVQVYYFLFPI